MLELLRILRRGLSDVLKANNNEDAIEIFERLDELSPNNDEELVELRKDLGYAIKNEDNEHAIEIFKRWDGLSYNLEEL